MFKMLKFIFVLALFGVHCTCNGDTSESDWRSRGWYRPRRNYPSQSQSQNGFGIRNAASESQKPATNFGQSQGSFGSIGFNQEPTQSSFGNVEQKYQSQNERTSYNQGPENNSFYSNKLHSQTTSFRTNNGQNYQNGNTFGTRNSGSSLKNGFSSNAQSRNSFETSYSNSRVDYAQNTQNQNAFGTGQSQNAFGNSYTQNTQNQNAFKANYNQQPQTQNSFGSYQNPPSQNAFGSYIQSSQRQSAFGSAFAQNSLQYQNVTSNNFNTGSSSSNFGRGQSVFKGPDYLPPPYVAPGYLPSKDLTTTTRRPFYTTTTTKRPFYTPTTTRLPFFTTTTTTRRPFYTTTTTRRPFHTTTTTRRPFFTTTTTTRRPFYTTSTTRPTFTPAPKPAMAKRVPPEPEDDPTTPKPSTPFDEESSTIIDDRKTTKPIGRVLPAMAMRVPPEPEEDPTTPKPSTPFDEESVYTTTTTRRTYYGSGFAAMAKRVPPEPEDDPTTPKPSTPFDEESSTIIDDRKTTKPIGRVLPAMAMRVPPEPEEDPTTLKPSTPFDEESVTIDVRRVQKPIVSPAMAMRVPPEPEETEPTPTPTVIVTTPSTTTTTTTTTPPTTTTTTTTTTTPPPTTTTTTTTTPKPTTTTTTTTPPPTTTTPASTTTPDFDRMLIEETPKTTTVPPPIPPIEPYKAPQYLPPKSPPPSPAMAMRVQSEPECDPSDPSTYPYPLGIDQRNIEDPCTFVPQRTTTEKPVVGPACPVWWVAAGVGEYWPPVIPVRRRTRVGRSPKTVKLDDVNGARPVWHVGLYTKTTTPYKQICGGSIVRMDVVITAAHCVWDDKTLLEPASNYAVGANKIYRPWTEPHDKRAQKSDVREIIVPPRFRGGKTSFQDDIAILRLATPFNYARGLRPVCVDFDDEFDSEQLSEGNSGTVAGWGYTDDAGSVTQYLLWLELPYVDIEKCISGSDDAFLKYITSDKICAGENHTGKALCKGDSGGGLVFWHSEGGLTTPYLRGVASASARADNKECNVNVVGGFTQLAAHRRFLKQHVPDIDINCNYHVN